MKQLRTVSRPEVIIFAAGLVILALVAVELGLVQAALTSVSPVRSTLDPLATWNLTSVLDLLWRYSWVLILLVMAIFAGLGLMLVRNRRAGEQQSAELEHKIQERTAQLAYERNLLRTLLDHIPAEVYIKDAQGRFLDANAMVAQKFGVDAPEALVGKTDLDLRANAAQDFALEQNVLATGEPLLNRETVDAENHRWRLENKIALRDGQGKIVGLVGLNWYITERKQTEQALQQRADEFAALYESSRDLASQTDLASLLDTLVLRARQLLKTPWGDMALYDAARGDLEFVVTQSRATMVGTRRQMGVGVVGRVAETRQPMYVNDYPAWDGRMEKYAESGIRSVLAVPMLYRGELVGVLCVIEVGAASRDFGEADVRLLSLFAQQAASAVYNARSLETQRRAREQAEKLLAATQALGATLDLQQVLELILKELQQVVPYDSASVQELKGDQLEILGGVGFTNLAEIVGTRFNIVNGDNPNKHVIASRKPLILEDAGDEYHNFREKRFDVLEIHSWLGVPLLFGERIIGMLTLDKREPQFYAPASAQLALAFATQAAIAIENARLFEKTQDALAVSERSEAALRRQTARLRVAADLGRAVTAILEIDQVVPQIATLINEYFGYYHIGLFLIDESGKWAVLKGNNGEMPHPLDGKEFRLPVGNPTSMIGYVTGNGRAYVSSDVSADPHYYFEPTLPDVRSEAVFPLIAGGKIIGALDISSDTRDAFKADDISILSLVADQAAIAIQNARLYQAAQQELAERKRAEAETRERNRELEVITRISEIYTSTLDTTDALQQMAREMTKIFRARNCGIAVLNAEGTELQVIADALDVKHAQRAVGIVIPVLGNPSSQYVIETGKSLVIPHAQTDPRTELIHERMKQRGTHCLAIVPLLSKTQVIGTIGLDMTDPNAVYSEREIRLAETIATQMAGVLEKAQLFELTQQHAQELAAINQVASAISQQLELEQLLETVHSQIQRVMSVDAFFVALLDETGECVSFPFIFDDGKRFPAETERQLPVGNVKRAIAQGEPLLLRRTPAELRDKTTSGANTIGAQRYAASLLFVPMRIGARIIGCISAQSYEFNAYSSREADVLVGIANHVAIAIQNANLFKESQNALQKTQLALLQVGEAQGKLEESELRLRTLFAASPDAIIVVDPHDPVVLWPIMDCNQVISRMTGYTRQELIGQSINLVNVTPASRAEFDEFVARVRENGVVRMETAHRHKDGHEYPIEISMTLITSSGRELLMGIARDITERKLAEERLRANESLYRSLVEAIPQCVTRKDLQGRITFGNSRYLADTQKTPAEIYGKTDFDFHPYELATKYWQDDMRIIRSGEPLDTIEEHERGDGARTFVHVIKTPLRDDAGNINGIQTMFWDITSEREQSERLREREELLSRVLETVEDGIYIVDRTGKMTFINKATERIIGITRDQILGAQYNDARWQMTTLDGKPFPEAQQPFTQIMATGEPVYDVEQSILRADGTRVTVSINAAPLHDADGKVVGEVASMTDITARKQAENQLRESERLLRQAQQIAHVGSWRWDFETGHLEWSEEMYRIYGMEHADLTHDIRQVIEQTVHPDDRARVHQATDKSLNGHAAPLEYRVVHRDGQERTVWTEGEIVRDASGTPLGMVGIVQDITERKHAEAELRRQNEYLDALHETTINLIGRLHLHDLLQAIVQRAAKLMDTQHGYIYLHETDADEMAMSVGVGLFEQMVGTATRRGVGATGVVWETGEALLIDNYQLWDNRLHKRGTSEVRALVSIPLKSRDQVVGVFGVAYSDAEHKFDETSVDILTRFAQLAAIALDNARLYDAAQQELTERTRAEEKFRALFTASPDAILLLDPSQPHWPIVDCNQAACDMNGYTREELIGQSIDILNTAPGTPEERAEYLETIRRSGILHVEAEHRRRDGQIIVMETSTCLLTLGEHEMVLGIDRDVTERRRVEREMTHQREVLQTVFDNSPVMIGMFDVAGHYTLINREWEQTLGYTVEEMNRGDVMVGMYPDTDQRLAARSFMFAPTEGWRDFKTVVRDGQVLDTSWAYKPLSNGMTIAFAQDITQRKQVDRLKNEFISTVSHELRTPLTSIRGSLGLIAGGVAGEIPDRARSMIDIAYKNSERLVRLINDILDIEKIESGKMVFQFKPLELAPLIEASVEANRAYGAQYNVGFIIRALPRDILVNADADRLTQVLTNLLSNAVKFSPSGGRVEIEVTRHAALVRVAVHDDGPGIPEEFKPRIFQKFAQADASDTRQKGGTGLGLSIVKAIVEKHGGNIGFRSAEGGGTTFYFELPVYQVAPLPAQSPFAAKPRILILEDDRDVALLLSLMLHQGGFETDVAYKAMDALELVRLHSYAAITLDLTLPDRDGISLIRELRANLPTRELPIVVVSAKAEQGKQQLNGDAIWVEDWLQKPIDQNLLVRAVLRASRRLHRSKPHILHVEDDGDVLQVVQAILQDTADVTPARDYAEARQLLAREEFDLVLLDLVLPDNSGSELLPFLRRGDTQIPVVIFSAREQDQNLVNYVSATLIKSRTTNEQLLKTITHWIGVQPDGETREHAVATHPID